MGLTLLRWNPLYMYMLMMMRLSKQQTNCISICKQLRRDYD